MNYDEKLNNIDEDYFSEIIYDINLYNDSMQWVNGFSLEEILYLDMKNIKDKIKKASIISIHHEDFNGKSMPVVAIYLKDAISIINEMLVNVNKCNNKIYGRYIIARNNEEFINKFIILINILKKNIIKKNEDYYLIDCDIMNNIR